MLGYSYFNEFIKDEQTFENNFHQLIFQKKL